MRTTSFAISMCLGVLAAVLFVAPRPAASAEQTDGQFPGQPAGLSVAPSGAAHIESAPVTLALSGYLAEAAEGNHGLRAAFNRFKAALEQEAVVTSLPDPRFSFAWFAQPVETRVGPQQYKYGLSQNLPWFGKLGLKGDQALREADARKAEFDALKLKVFLDVKKAFYEYAYLAQAIRITRDNMELLKYLEGVVRARYTAGSGDYAGVIRAQVELGKLDDRLTTLKKLRGPVAANLRAALGRPVDGARTLAAPEAIPLMRMRDSADVLLNEFASSNPRLHALAALREKELAGVDLAQKDYYPDFTLGAEYIQTGDSRSPNVVNKDVDPLIFGLSFNLPIRYGRRDAQVRAAKARVRSATRSLEGLRESLRAELEFALFEYDEAVRKASLYKDNLIPMAEQALGVTVESFQAGTATSGDLIDSERVLIEFQLAYHRALADQAQRVALVEMLVGREIPCTVHGSLEPAAVSGSVPISDLKTTPAIPPSPGASPKLATPAPQPVQGEKS